MWNEPDACKHQRCTDSGWSLKNDTHDIVESIKTEVVSGVKSTTLRLTMGTITDKKAATTMTGREIT